MMKAWTALALLVLAAPSPEIRHFRYRRAVQNTSQSKGQTCLVLDAALFPHAAPQLSDLRLYHEGAETPYVIRMAAPVDTTQKPISPLNLGIRAGEVAFDAEMPQGSYSDISLDVNAHDFIATVTVSGSHTNDESSSTRLGTYTIFDLTGQKLGRSTVLHLPASDFHYLHFHIKGPIRPADVVGLSAGRLPAMQLKYELVAQATSFRQESHTSVAEITVPAHVPVDRLAFTVGSDPANFSRTVKLSVVPAAPAAVSQDTEPPQPVASSGNLLRVHGMQEGHRIDEEHLTVEAPEVSFASAAKWVIAIDNGDDAPLRLNSVRLEMLQRSLCFENAAGGQYTLFYGDPALAASRYDYATLFAYQPAGPEATAGPEQLNAAYQPRPDQRPFSERHPALLWIALLAVIALLGAVALRSAKRTDASQ